MSVPLRIQAGGTAIDTPGYGRQLVYATTAPVNGHVGFAPGCLYFVLQAWSGTTSIYINTGTVLSATWTAVILPGLGTIPAETIAALTVTGAESVGGVLTPTGGIAATGGFAASPRLVHTGNEPAIATTSGVNSANNSANTIYLAECFVPCNMSVTGAALFNGTAVAGNVKMILYSLTGTTTGTKVAQSASTAVSGTTGYQLVPFTGGPIAVLGPATYFIGAIFDDTTNDLRSHVVGSFGAGTYSTSVVYATDSTLTPVTLPTTFTTAVGPIASLY
jgi:hypothetical protein